MKIYGCMTLKETISVTVFFLLFPLFILISINGINNKVYKQAAYITLRILI